MTTWLEGAGRALGLHGRYSTLGLVPVETDDWRTALARTPGATEHHRMAAFLATCRLLDGPETDQGHPGGMPRALWRLPGRYGPGKVLHAFNGTRGSDGLWQPVLLQVDWHCRTATQAAAWTYGMTAEQYSACERRV